MLVAAQVLEELMAVLVRRTDHSLGSWPKIDYDNESVVPGFGAWSATPASENYPPWVHPANRAFGSLSSHMRFRSAETLPWRQRQLYPDATGGQVVDMRLSPASLCCDASAQGL